MNNKETLLIPSEYLTKNTKILFMTHCALGDFTYMQPFFRALKKKYPNLIIDFWADEVRRTYFFWRWKYLKNYILYDWLYSCSFFDKLYTQTYSWSLFYESITEAQRQEYPIVISFCTLRSRMYARYARQISPDGLVIGIASKKENRYSDLDSELPITFENDPEVQWHISDMYNEHFKRLFGIELTREERFPSIDIPPQWADYGKRQITKWGISPRQPILFINPFAKDKKRCWDITCLPTLLTELSRHERYYAASFIINAPPQHYEQLKSIMFPKWRSRVFLFMGSDNFFQLPSMIKSCELIISVETSIMHLAIALKKPLIALMRLKTLEWIPLGHPQKYILFTEKRSNLISSIPPQKVVDAIVSLRRSMTQEAWSK